MSLCSAIFSRIVGRINELHTPGPSKIHLDCNLRIFITAERCELKSTCTLEGDLKAPRLIVEEGATFIGTSLNTLASTVETPETASDGKPSGSSQARHGNLSTQKQTGFWR